MTDPREVPKRGLEGDPALSSSVHRSLVGHGLAGSRCTPVSHWPCVATKLTLVEACFRDPGPISAARSRAAGRGRGSKHEPLRGSAALPHGGSRELSAHVPRPKACNTTRRASDAHGDGGQVPRRPMPTQRRPRQTYATWRPLTRNEALTSTREPVDNASKRQLKEAASSPLSPSRRVRDEPQRLWAGVLELRPRSNGSDHPQFRRSREALGPARGHKRRRHRRTQQRRGRHPTSELREPETGERSATLPLSSGRVCPDLSSTLMEAPRR